MKAGPAVARRLGGARGSAPIVAAGVAACAALLLSSIAVGNARADGLDGLASHPWTIVPSPNVTAPPLNNLNDVSCSSRTQCVAVGLYYVGGVSGTPRPLAETWNGTAWSLAALDAAYDAGRLNSVSCVATDWCVAVGEARMPGGGFHLLIEVESAGTWTAVPPAPTTDIAVLQSISCTSRSFCIAIGSDQHGTLLSEVWDGESWTERFFPVVGTLDRIEAVSCISPTSCVAVGLFFAPVRPNVPLVDHWDGHGWSVVSASDEPEGVLMNASCVSEYECVAVGSQTSSGGTSTLVETIVDNRGTWVVAPSPNPGSFGQFSLADVSCLTAADCAAVGGGAGLTLVESWDGTEWTIVPSPNHQHGGSFDALVAVSCTDPSFCVGVGSSDAGTTSWPLVEQWDGTAWTFASEPVVPGAANNQLTSIACTSTTRCVSVGTHGNEYEEPEPLAESWDGTRWRTTETDSLTQPAPYEILEGVSCASAHNCTAVGTTNNTTTLIQVSNGGDWHVVASPNEGDELNGLTDVSCPSVDFCAAVGFFAQSATAARTQIQHWDGQAWSTVPSPNVESGNDELLSVDCPSAAFCVATGDVDDGSADHPLIETWDGTSWSLADSADPPLAGRLSGVSCASTTFCFAVGYSTASGVNHTLAERWDGVTWSTVSMPGSTKRATLIDVACATAATCTAVGQSGSGPFATPLVEVWNESWRVSAADPAQPGPSLLAGVACVSKLGCTAVGARGTVAQTLVERPG